MKNTLSFYKKIYEPLFQKKYTTSTNRGKVAIRKFEEFSKANKIKIKKVVDIGCAWGYTLQHWRKRSIKCVGVDVSKTAISHCKREGYQCYLSSATDLSVFNDKKFDLYMATDVYEHLREKDLEHAIEEAKRITKRYFLIRPHPSLDKMGREDKRKALHLTVWDLDKWEDFFESHGLNIIKIGDDGASAYKNVFLMSIDS